MYILNGSCGWLPEGPVKFIAKIIEIIRNLTPVILIIMGSIDFAKAVMSQDDSQIKKAQGAFIKKIIAGIAVFFVIVIIQWIAKIINNADESTGAGNASACLDALLNGNYKQDDKKYYKQPEYTGTTKSFTTTTLTCETCIQKYATKIEKCINSFEEGAYQMNEAGYKKAYETCENDYTEFKDQVSKYYDYCVDSNSGSAESCSSYKTNIETYINSYNLNYDYNSKVLCEIAITDEEKNNCYNYDQYHEACVKYAKDKQQTGNEKTYCEQEYCKMCK